VHPDISNTQTHKHRNAPTEDLRLRIGVLVHFDIG